MSRMSNGYRVSSSSEQIEATTQASIEPLSEYDRTSPELRPNSASELATKYRVGDRSVLIWYKHVLAAYPWIDPNTLKTGTSAKTRYTPLCQTLFDEYREGTTDSSAEDWIASVHADHPSEYQAWLKAQSHPNHLSQPVTYTFQAPASIQDQHHSSDVAEDGEESEIRVETTSALTIASPLLPQTYTLTDVQPIEAPSFDDPLALARQVMQAAGHIKTAMQQDIVNKRRKLAETQEAAILVEKAVTELDLDRRFYQAKTEELVDAQTRSTQTLSELASMLQKLGKPSTSTEPPAVG